MVRTQQGELPSGQGAFRCISSPSSVASRWGKRGQERLRNTRRVERESADTLIYLCFVGDDALASLQYGTGLVESSLSAVSRPLANNLQLGQLDDFACRQLDRLGATTSSPGNESGGRASDYLGGSSERPESRGRAGAPSSSSGGGGGSTSEEWSGHGAPSPSREQAVAVEGRSRWQTVLVEAGGLGAAVSEESLKSLRYCLQWLLVSYAHSLLPSLTLWLTGSMLQYATAHLDHQITTLRDFIASLQRQARHDGQSDALVTASASAHLSQIKHDVVETIRKVVDVVSKYAGVALPEQAKRYVRQSILGLPVKWASAIEGGRRDGRGASVGAASDVSTPRAERMDDPYAMSGVSPAPTSTAAPGAQQVVLGRTEEAAERVLTFAVESLDMLKSVTSIFGESVQKAEE